MNPRAMARTALALISLVGLVAGCSPRQRPAVTSREPVRDAHTSEVPQVQAKATNDALVPIPENSAAAPPKESAPPIESASTPSRPIQLREFLPHIWLDTSARVVEFTGIVPINAHDERAPHVYLEVLACSSDTREHEAVVVTDAKPSQVHAALLAIGLEPGAPGSYSWQGEQVQASPPTGPRVRVDVIVGDAPPAPITDWAINVRSGETLTATLDQAGHAMLFAGSVSIERERGTNYLGDGAGTLVGLATFGTETIACESLFNPDSAVEEPVWIANAALVPATGTAVRVRITTE